MNERSRSGVAATCILFLYGEAAVGLYEQFSVLFVILNRVFVFMYKSPVCVYFAYLCDFIVL